MDELLSNSEEKFRKLDHRDKAMRTFEVFILVALVSITLFSLLRLNQVADSNQKNISDHRMQIETGNDLAEKQLKEASTGNRARSEVGLCIFSVSPTRRTPEYVKGCYDQIDKKYNVEVPRFGDGIK